MSFPTTVPYFHEEKEIVIAEAIDNSDTNVKANYNPNLLYKKKLVYIIKEKKLNKPKTKDLPSFEPGTASTPILRL